MAKPKTHAQELGAELGQRAGEVLKLHPELVPLIADEVLEAFQAIFPTNPDEETERIQALILAPLIAKHILHRGIRIEELTATMAQPSRSFYRWMKQGLSLLFRPSQSMRPRGVNRRYTLRDDRHSYYELSPVGFRDVAAWPSQLREYHGFLLGLLNGFEGWLAIEPNRRWFEGQYTRALATVFRDSRLPAILTGAFEGTQRVGMKLRELDSVPALERERIQNALDGLVALRAELPRVTAMFHEVARQLERPRKRSSDE